jgi:hypothetical protein
MSKRLILGALILVGAASPSAAQGIITGRITSDVDKRPVPHAEVSLFGSAWVRVDSAGAFRLLVRGDSTLTFFARAVGHQMHTRRIDMRGLDSLVLSVTLLGVPQSLDSINVRGEAPAASPRMIGFEQRRRGPEGHFHTREDLAKREAMPVSNVLRLSNLQVVPRPSSWGGGYAVATGRGASMDMDVGAMGGVIERGANVGGAREGSLRERARTVCYATVYIDGVVLWAPGQGAPPNIDQLKVHDLEGIEVYRSALETPLAFRATRTPCGAVILWTRVGGGSRP